MNRYSLTHLSDGAVLSGLESLVRRGCIWTAELLAHLSEVESRRLYAPVGYSSMYKYCVHELHFSEQVALKHLRVARMARRFPAIFEAVAQGHVHVSGLLLIKPYMTRRTGDELLVAITHKSCSEIESLMAHRFPRPDVPTHVVPIPVPHAPMSEPGSALMTSTPVESLERSPTTVCIENQTSQLSARTVRVTSEVPHPIPSCDLTHPVVVPVTTSAPYPRVTPLAPGRFAVSFTMGKGMHDKLQRAQELLGFDVTSGDLAIVLERALDALIIKLEKSKCAATDRPRRSPPRTRDGSRHIPAHVKRAVRDRDGDRCTFVSPSGQRCLERKGLEYDHVEPFARGGRATVAGIRLRCRAHNQMEAEGVFGREFMENKRRESQSARKTHPDASDTTGAPRVTSQPTREALQAARVAMREVEIMCADP